MLSLYLVSYIFQISLFIVLVWLIRYCVNYLIYLVKINKLPGPPSLFLIGNGYVLTRENHRDRLPLLCSWWKQYRSQGFFRINVLHVNYVIPTTPENMELFLNSSHFIDKPYAYQFLHPWLGINLLTSGRKTWRLRRKLLTSAFHFKILEDFVEVINKHSTILIRKLAPQANGEVFDIFQFITLCTLDIICDTAMGSKQIKAQENKDSEYIQALYKISRIISEHIFNPYLYFELLFRLSTYARDHSKYINTLHRFTNKVIIERKAEFQKKTLNGFDDKKKRMAFLDILLRSTLKEGTFTDNDLRAEVDAFMFEGHDTTSYGISWTLYLLGRHTDIQYKVHEEIDKIFGKEERHITTNDLNRLKYLECVFKESMRLYPPVPMFGRHVHEDFKIDNYTIPKGTTIGILPFCMHRNPDIYPDPEKFDPDRFLTENIIGRHPFAYIPFSAGPRNCIGQKFALMEGKIVLAQVLRNYRVESVDPPEKMQLIAELTLRPLDGFKMKLYRRH